MRMTAHALAALHCMLLSSHAKTFEFVSGKSDGQNRHENPFGRLHSRVAWSPVTHSDCTRMVIIYSPVNPKSITHETVSIRTKLAKNLISRIDLGVLAKGATSPRFPSLTTVQASPKKSAAASSIRSSPQNKSAKALDKACRWVTLSLSRNIPAKSTSSPKLAWVQRSSSKYRWIRPSINLRRQLPSRARFHLIKLFIDPAAGFLPEDFAKAS